MASVGKRVWTDKSGKERISYQVRYKTLDGKTKRRQFDKRKDADEFRRKVEPMEPRNAHTWERYTSATTVEEAVNEYLEAIKKGVGGKPPVEESSHLVYTQRAQAQIIPRWGHIKLSDLNTPFCEILRDELVASSLSRSYAAHVWGLFKKVIRLMVSRGAISNDPISSVTIYFTHVPRTKNEDDEDDVNMPTVEEARRIMAYAAEMKSCKSKRLRKAWVKWEAMLQLGFETGMRIGEIIGLPWSNVNLQERTIYVRQTAKLSIGKIGKPKTKKAYRTIGITVSLADKLARWKEVCPQGPDNLVFPGRSGNLLDYNTFRNKVWKPTMRELGLVDEDGKIAYTIHSMRHFKASAALNAGANVFKLSRELGHANIQTTHDLYGHLMKLDGDDVSANADHIRGLLNVEIAST